MSTICGHELEALIWACEYAVDAPKLIHATIEVMDDRAGDAQKQAALIALTNPAKIAEIMAEALRNRGVDANAYRYGTDQAAGGDEVRVWYAYTNGKIQISIGRAVRSSFSRMVTQAQFRATLLRTLTLPEGTPIAEVLKALGR